MADRVPPNRKFNLGSMSKNVVFWVLIVLLSIAFYQMVNSAQQHSVEVDYSTFSRELDGDNIASVQITNGQYVQGEFKQQVTVDGRAVKQFNVLLPIQNSEALIQRLEAKNVRIDAKEPKPSP